MTETTTEATTRAGGGCPVTGAVDLPADLLADPAAAWRGYDVYDQRHADRRWELLAHARRECPVPFSESYGGQYHVTRYDDVRFVLEHPELFSSAVPAPTNEAPVRLPPLDADPPLQQEFRRILNPFLSRSYLMRFADRMREIANEAIDVWIDTGEVELISQFAMPYSAGVLATVVFDETDPRRVGRARDAATRAGTKADAESFFGLAMTAAEYLAEREDGLTDRDDIVGAVARGSVAGRPMTEDERLGVITVLFLGGLDTTRGAIGTVAARLATVDGLEQRMRRPGWARRDLDEILRLHSPVAIMARTVLSDVELGGQQLRAGDRLVVHFESADRDGDRFADPAELTFDVARPGNAVFGLGIHRCVGSHLARLQLEIGFDVLLSRIGELRLPDGMRFSDITFVAGAALGPEALPLRFTKR